MKRSNRPKNVHFDTAIFTEKSGGGQLTRLTGGMIEMAGTKRFFTFLGVSNIEIDSLAIYRDNMGIV